MGNFNNKNLDMKNILKTLIISGIGLLTTGCAEKSKYKQIKEIKPFVVTRDSYVGDDGWRYIEVVDVYAYGTGDRTAFDSVEWFNPEFTLKLNSLELGDVTRSVRYGDVLDLELHLPAHSISVPENKLLLNQDILAKRKAEYILKEKSAWCKARRKTR